MKKIALFLLLAGGFVACSDGRIDEGKIDAAGDKLQKTVKNGADSIAAKVDRFTDSLGRDTTDR
jgi:hypothetical protein